MEAFWGSGMPHSATPRSQKAPSFSVSESLWSNGEVTPDSWTHWSAELNAHGCEDWAVVCIYDYYAQTNNHFLQVSCSVELNEYKLKYCDITKWSGFLTEWKLDTTVHKKASIVLYVPKKSNGSRSVVEHILCKQEVPESIPSITT